jgi:hypothetical protein
MFLAAHRGFRKYARGRHTNRAVCPAMKYLDMQEVNVGDVVALAHDMRGVVVADIEKAEYGTGYSPADWSYLKSGILIFSEQAGLFHFEQPDEDLVLISRACHEY